MNDLTNEDIEAKKDARDVEGAGTTPYFSAGEAPVLSHGEGGVRLGLQSRQ